MSRLARFLRTDRGRRLRWMAQGWITVGLVYGSAGLLHREPTLLPESAIDRLVPFAPQGVWLYLSFFVLIPWAYLRADLARLPWLARTMQLCALTCGIVFLLWPTALILPALPAEGLSATVLGWLRAIDTRGNCLPSLHAALTLLCVGALIDRRHRLRSLFAIAWGLGIGIAILQVRQHRAIDLVAGALVALAAGALVMQLQRRRRSTAPTATRIAPIQRSPSP